MPADPQRLPKQPKYRHYKPKDLAVVRIDGRDVYLGRYGSPESHEKYRRVVGEWFMTGVAPSPQPKRGGAAAGDGPTVNEVMLGYVRFVDGYYVKNGKPTSESGMVKLSLRVLRRLYGETPAADFGPLALKAVRQGFIDAGLCLNEVNRRTRHVVRFFKWAVENELVPPSVHHGLKAVPGLRKGRSGVRETEPVGPVPDAFVDAIRPHVSRQAWAMVELQRLTGMRPGEVTILRTCDLDLSGTTWTYTPGSHKTEHHGKARKVPIGPRARDVLRPWLKTDLTAYLFSPREAEAERLAGVRARRKTPVKPSQRDRKRRGRRARVWADRYEVTVYYHAIARGCRKAGVPAWGPNRLRHNFATAIRRDAGLEVAQVVLGHASPDTTLIYAEADWKRAADAMERIG
jgi:integrase